MSKSERQALLAVMRVVALLCVALNRGLLRRRIEIAAERMGESLD